MIFESANQTSQVKAFLHGLVNPCMLITYTPGTQGTYAEVFSQRKAANIAHKSGRARSYKTEPHCGGYVLKS